MPEGGGIRITRDPGKERHNIRKHGLDFSFAAAIFADPLALTVFDRVVEDEEGWHTIGAVAAGSIFKVLLVVHSYPEPDDENWTRVISLREAEPRSEGDMNSRATERTKSSYPLTEAQIIQLRALEGRVPDTTDIPCASDANWATAVRGKHHAAMQGTVAVKLDEDVIAWLHRKGPDHQTEINRILREKMLSEA